MRVIVASLGLLFLAGCGGDPTVKAACEPYKFTFGDACTSGPECPTISCACATGSSSFQGCMEDVCVATLECTALCDTNNPRPGECFE